MRLFRHETKQAFDTLSTEYQSYPSLLAALSEKVDFDRALNDYRALAARRARVTLAGVRTTALLPEAKQILSGQRALASKGLNRLIHNGFAEITGEGEHRQIRLTEAGAGAKLEAASRVEATAVSEWPTTGAASTSKDVVGGSRAPVARASSQPLVTRIPEPSQTSDQVVVLSGPPRRDLFASSTDRLSDQLAVLQGQVALLARAVTPKCVWSWEVTSGTILFRSCGRPADQLAVDSLAAMRGPMALCERHAPLARIRGCTLTPLPGNYALRKLADLGD